MLRATDVLGKFANDVRWAVSMDRVDESSDSLQQCFEASSEFDGDGIEDGDDDDGGGDGDTDSVIIDCLCVN